MRMRAGEEGVLCVRASVCCGTRPEGHRETVRCQSQGECAGETERVKERERAEKREDDHIHHEVFRGN